MHEFHQGFCRNLVCGSTVQLTWEAPRPVSPPANTVLPFEAPSMVILSTQCPKPELLVWTRQLCKKEKIWAYHRIIEEHVWRDLKSHLVQPFLSKAQSRQDGPELCRLNFKSVQCWGIHHFLGSGESRPCLWVPSPHNWLAGCIEEILLHGDPGGNSQTGAEGSVTHLCSTQSECLCSWGRSETPGAAWAPPDSSEQKSQ